MKQNTNISQVAMQYLPMDEEYFESKLLKAKKLDDGYLLITEIGEMLCPPNELFAQSMDADNQIVRFYGKGLGYRIRGVTVLCSLNKKSTTTTIFYYKTPVEDEIEFQKYLKESEDKEKASFEKNKEVYKKEFESLPEVCQKQILQFRKNNPDFYWQYEPYQLFCLKEAIKIANKLKTVEAINNWRGLPWDAQRKIVNLSDGHSGNTFGYCVWIAKTYLTNPELIVDLHAAMCSLVGCEKIGHIIEEKREKNEKRKS